MPWYVVWWVPLTHMPEWLVLTLFVYVVCGLPQRLQNKYDGIGWNVAFSSFEGAICETGVLGIGIESMRAVTPTLWMQSHALLIATISVAVALGIALSWFFAVRRVDKHPGRTSDEYHNTVVVFIVAYFVLPCFLFVLISGTLSQRIAVIVFAIIYVRLVVFDKNTGRSEQPEFMLLSGALTRFLRAFNTDVDEIVCNMSSGRSPVNRPWWKSKEPSQFYGTLAGLEDTLRGLADSLARLKSEQTKP